MTPRLLTHVPVGLLVAQGYFAPWRLVTLWGMGITARVLVSKN